MENKLRIGLKLRELREEKGYNAKDVVELLSSNYGIELQFKTLYSYENGRTFPNTDVFLALCLIYNCRDILYTFGYTDKPNAYTVTSPEDALIVEKYNNLTPSGKNMILGALGIEKNDIQQKIS